MPSSSTGRKSGEIIITVIICNTAILCPMAGRCLFEFDGSPGEFEITA